MRLQKPHNVVNDYDGYCVRVRGNVRDRLFGAVAKVLVAIAKLRLGGPQLVVVTRIAARLVRVVLDRRLGLPLAFRKHPVFV